VVENENAWHGNQPQLFANRQYYKAQHQEQELPFTEIMIMLEFNVPLYTSQFISEIRPPSRQLTAQITDINNKIHDKKADT